MQSSFSPYLAPQSCIHQNETPGPVYNIHLFTPIPLCSSIGSSLVLQPGVERIALADSWNVVSVPMVLSILLSLGLFNKRRRSLPEGISECAPETWWVVVLVDRFTASLPHPSAPVPLHLFSSSAPSQEIRSLHTESNAKVKNKPSSEHLQHKSQHIDPIQFNSN